MHHRLSIETQSDTVILRSIGGDTAAPATLHGNLLLELSENADIKDLLLVFSGKAKLGYHEASMPHRTSTLELPLHFYDQPFLPSSSSHTLKAGRHSFPFSLTIPGTLPASFKTPSSVLTPVDVTYKIKAVASRSGFGMGKWTARKEIKIIHSLLPDAAEFTQTLEIDNTWPDKVMYNFTLPHKAFAAGDIIPVAVKFTPIGKGVKVIQLHTTIQEAITVVVRASQHSDTRDIASQRLNFTKKPQSGLQSRVASHSDIPSSSRASSTSARHLSRPTSPVPVAAAPVDEEDDMENPDIDITTHIPIPVWATPTHTINPTQVSHKIRWSAYIRNLDGHISELRCALPIHILSASLAEEATLASSGTRSLLFGPSGVLMPTTDGIQQVDLPSYQNHVLDRIANAETSTTPSGFELSSWASPAESSTPASTPPTTSALRRRPLFNLDPFSPFDSDSSDYFTSRASSEFASRADSRNEDLPPVPTRPQIDWADRELLSTLSLESPTTPSALRELETPSPHSLSRTTSRSSSHPNSRGSSRPASPSLPPEPSTSQERPSFFSALHIPKPLRLTPFTRPSDPSVHRRHSTPNISELRRSSSGGAEVLAQVPSYEVAARGFLGGGVVPLSASEGLPSYDEASRPNSPVNLPRSQE